MQIIPISPVPSQSLTVLLAGQRCQIDLYQKLYGLFLDLYVSDVRLIAGALCLDRNRLVRSAYIGFVGDLILFDTDGAADPVSTGLGSRFQLAYLEADELITVDDPSLALKALKAEIDELLSQQSAGMAVDAAKFEALSARVQQAIAAADAARAEADAAYSIASAASPAARQIATSGLAFGGGDLTADRTITVLKATKADVAAGTNDTKALTSLSVSDLAPLSSVVRTDVAQTLDAATRSRVKQSIGAFGVGWFSLSAAATLDASAAGKAIYLGGGAFDIALPAINVGEIIKFQNASTAIKTLTAPSGSNISFDATFSNTLQIQPYATMELFSIGSGNYIVLSKNAPMKLFDDPWTAYTPTVSFGSGTANNVTAAGKYKKIGKTVHFRASCLISDKGTAGNSILLGLPTPSIEENSCSGVEEGATGWQISGQIPAGTNYIVLRKYDGDLSAIISNGHVLVVSGTYETN